MAIREILLYPQHSAALRKKSVPNRSFDSDTKRLIRDLKDTLRSRPDGVGLAAPQVNVHQRIVVVRLGTTNAEVGPASLPIGLVNPEIIEARDDRKDFDGCLSFPGLYGRTIRPHYLRVISLDERGRPGDTVFEGFDAVVVHHEIDHLDGVLFIDRIECLEDLYRVRDDGRGQMMRVPIKLPKLVGRE